MNHLSNPNSERRFPEPSSSRSERLLVFNCHEAWVHQLSRFPMQFDLITDLHGKPGWDYQMRPIPNNARIVSLKDVLSENGEYHCIIAHNISDLMDAKGLPGPRLIVLHSTLEGRVKEEKSDVSPAQFSEMLRKYLDIISGHAVAVTELKCRSWNITDDVVHFGVDLSDYLPHEGTKAAGLRICNRIAHRRKILRWDFHEKAFADLPVTLVGHNPEIPGVKAAANWDELKKILSEHRFYIHTADPELEDGYNMAMMEAMAAGLPVLGNRHPSSPIENGINGFLSDDPAELNHRAKELLSDANLCQKMGAQAQKAVAEKFSLKNFFIGLERSISTAREKWAHQQERS